MKLHAVVDLQFGSTGKGLLAGYLTRKNHYDTAISANSTQAGHTYVETQNGKRYEWIARHLPIAAALPSVKQVLIGPGAMVEPPVLEAECAIFEQQRIELGRGELPEILIHENAGVILPYHQEEERATMAGVGSTMKGVGAALVHKIRRMRTNANIAAHALHDFGPVRVVKHRDYLACMASAREAILEGSQGYSLGINSGFYPYTTSRECTVTQLMSDALVPFDAAAGARVYGVARTYPIRVANRTDIDPTSSSGPCYPDQVEMSWDELGQTPEVTTVTKKTRRVFSFSPMQITQAIYANGVDSVFLNFVNYLRNVDQLDDIVDAIDSTGADVEWIGLGPSVDDVVALREFDIDSYFRRVA
jgi:adenylosuccinate synthase